MEHLSGLDMGAWMEDGDSAFEAIQQQADAGLDYMVNMILERVNETEGSAPADNISGQANHEAGKSETTDNVFKGFGSEAAEEAAQDIESEADQEMDEDMESGTDLETDRQRGSETAGEAVKRAEHEAAEAKRKAEWEARQQAKKAAEQEQMNRLQAMSNEEVMAASMQRISTDTERLTRRNMKECVSEYIQTKCLDDSAFARLALHPRKTMIHCFWYINRKAREFIQQEMKDNDTKPENGVYGGDVPDELCYQWAEEYFGDPDAEEDREKEEKFVAKPYSGKSSAGKSSSSKKQNKTADKKTVTDKQADKSAPTGQMSFIGQMSLPGFEEEVKAG